jgi:hypothetical protein
VIPLRDDTERDRPPTLALLLAVAVAVGALVALVAGAGGWTALLLAVDAVAIWIFGGGVEGAVGRGWMVLAIVFGGAGGAALALAAGADDRTAAVGAAAATGIALELVVTHLIRLRGARILSMVLVPWFGSFSAVPAAIWGLIWAALAVLLLALGALAA